MRSRYDLAGMVGDPASPLSCDLVEFFESGVSILVATRDAAMRSSCARAMGARVLPAPGPDGCSVVRLHLPGATATRMLANLRDNGRIAVTFSRPLTHYSIQIKGDCIGIAPTDDEGRQTQLHYRAAYTEQLHAIGLPRPIVARFVWWPSVALDVAARDLFVQTPGPSAGRRLATRADGGHDGGTER